MIHKQENNNIKEVIPLLLRFWTPRQSSQLGDPTKGLGSPRESDLEDHQDLIIGLPQGLRETKTPILEKKNNLVCINTEWKGEVIPQKTESKLPASVRGSPVGAWVSRDSPQWQAHWKVPLGINPFESESEVAQSCPTLCDPMDCSLPGSSVHGIFQAIVLEWIAISFSKGSSQPRDWTQISRIVDRCFTIWATREVLSSSKADIKTS